MRIKEFIATANPVENPLSCILNMVDAWNLAGLSQSLETRNKLTKQTRHQLVLPVRQSNYDLEHGIGFCLF